MLERTMAQPIKPNNSQKENQTSPCEQKSVLCFEVASVSTALHVQTPGRLLVNPLPFSAKFAIESHRAVETYFCRER